jgi:pimeloyl-ACP methyl ester carboxylesterase
MTPDQRPDHLVWRQSMVDGRVAMYGTAGQGLPVLFLHGWGLAHHAYKRSLRRLVDLGCQVFSPAMPGFGGTPDLSSDQMSFAGYAGWVSRFLQSVEVNEPVFVVGHSFGGGVAISLAHDFPLQVRFLVLVNSVGGSTWSSAGSTIRSMAERPLWDWGLHLPEDLLPLRQVTRVLPVILEDALPNLVRNPLGLWKVANLARRADLTAELQQLRDRQVPVVVLWGEQDAMIPRASFDALCAAIGSKGEVVAGRHSWLIADPDAFGEVMTNSVTVAKLAREMEETDRQSREPGPTLGRRLIRRIGLSASREGADRPRDSPPEAAPDDRRLADE